MHGLGAKWGSEVWNPFHIYVFIHIFIYRFSYLFIHAFIYSLEASDRNPPLDYRRRRGYIALYQWMDEWMDVYACMRMHAYEYDKHA